MKIGKWAIQWDGSGYSVGRIATRTREGKEVEEAKDRKFYPTLALALGSLPEREAALVWNDCKDMEEFRAKMEGVAQEILEPLAEALKTKASGIQD